MTSEEGLINRGEGVVAMVTRTQKAGALWRALPDRSYVIFSERRGQLMGPSPT